MSLDAPGPRVHPNFAQALRWLGEGVWRVEHAFERSKAEARPADDTRLRIFFILAIFALAFSTLAFEAARAALFSKAGGSGLSAPVPAEARADVIDRQGRLLALDLPHFGLYLDPREVWDTEETRRGIRAALPKLSAERLGKALKSNRREYLIGGLTPQERARVHDLGLPGVMFEEEGRRVYPLGRSAAHLIGFSDSGGHGLAGSERALDAPIRAGAGAGHASALSLDLRVQAALGDELRKGMAAHQATAAVGLVTDVHTGEILGMVSLPDFDPNRPGEADPNTLVNRAAASVYEMGSTFKIFTFAMGLDAGVANVRTTFDASVPLKIGSRAIHDYHAENKVMSLEDIFIHSSNIGTAKLALSAGQEKLARYFRAFGLLEPAKVELAESARPITPRRWDPDTVASASFGAAISVSPLAVAAATGAIMNGGTYVPLTIEKRAPGYKPQGHRVVSAETSRVMLDLMRMNVLRGSGGKADAPGLRVGGKTGSAEKAINGRYERERLVSSFAAVFPTDGRLEAPRYMVLILYDEPKGTKETFGFRTAGWNAAPTAGRVIDRIAPFLGVARAPVTPFAPSRSAATPVDDESTRGAL
ncbi:MAG: penicillin-binding protein [Caulobacter vibrioides]|uniref:Penicillin-binding protein n=1 Tax=Caulobacter vibrioides TaxID=155892 RepID=A0A258DA78_CAUVI|nr:MAG: penicillin-binding protein [Caulobacter vibrioides]